MDTKRIVIGISGASGIVYGTRLVEKLVSMDWEVHLLVSPSAWRVMQAEMGIEAASPSLPLTRWLRLTGEQADQKIVTYNVRDIAAPMASGTFKAHAMAIVPCSMKTAASLATGFTDNLLTRCADCFLKEKRPVLVVPRETPLSTIHLRNLLTLSEAGVHVLPAMPAFYHNPSTIDDLIDFLTMKILEALRIEHDYAMEWKGPRA